MRAALGSGLIYSVYLAFAFLPRYIMQPKVHLFNALGNGVFAPILYTLGIIVLFALSITAWRAVRDATGWEVRLWALAPPLVFALLLLLTMPLTSRDIFFYAMSGRVLSIYGQNPYTVAPSAFPHDPLFVFSNWPDYTSPYGPIWLVVSGGLTRLAGDDITRSVLLLKLVAVGGYLACGGLIGAILRTRRRAVLPGMVFWLWNPLVLIEFAGAGHNDVLMLAGLLLGLWLYLRGWLRLAFGAVALAAMVKLVALVILPILLWHRLMALNSWRARIWETVRLAWVPAIVTALCLVPFWAGEATLGPVKESDHYYSSAGHIARIMLEWFLPPRPAGDLVKGTIVAILLVGYGLILWRTPGDDKRLLAACTSAMLLLIVLWPFFVPWYCAWAVAMVATLGSGRVGRRVLILCLGATLSYIFQLYLPVRMTTSVEFRSTLSAILIFCPFAISLLPWGVWLGRLRDDSVPAPLSAFD
jgi:alpha-1,6-mannosyltransferase